MVTIVRCSHTTFGYGNKGHSQPGETKPHKKTSDQLLPQRGRAQATQHYVKLDENNRKSDMSEEYSIP